MSLVCTKVQQLKGGIMKETAKKLPRKSMGVQKAAAKTGLLSEKNLAYCGYKLVGNKLIPTGKYNPVPYEGL